MADLAVERLSDRGEGVCTADGARILVPFTVPGDIIRASGDGERGTLEAVLQPSPDRVPPFCPYWTRCGGCATQTVALPVQLACKRERVRAALAREGVDAPVEPCLDAHGDGRRRATFHARRGAEGRIEVGFMAARSHDLVAIDHCPLFAPAMAGAVPAAQAVAAALASKGKPLDIAVTATGAGLDVAAQGAGPLDDREAAALIAAAERADLARVSNGGRVVATFRPPTVAVGAARVALPPNPFLQATEAGEATLSRLVAEGIGGAKRVADLFSGVGTFALRLVARASVHAAEGDSAAIAALLEAAWPAGARALTGERRDLARRPLSAADLARFDAAVFDPPRAGAPEQAQELARSAVPTVIGVSCNPQTFARDARTLIDGGYRLESATPVDQFRHSAHVEIVGVFRRANARPKRSLLG